MFIYMNMYIYVYMYKLEEEIYDGAVSGAVKEKRIMHKHTTRTPPQTTTRRIPPSLNNDGSWRGDGAYHLPHPGG